MKNKLVKALCLLVCIFLLIFISFLTINDMNKISTETDINEGNNISKEEYIYKEELLNLHYTSDEIKIIENKINITDVEKYLLNNKYNNLVGFLESSYFNITNIERYQNYYDKNNTYTPNECVTYVEIGLDYDFYTNIKETDTSQKYLMLINKYNKLTDEYKVTLSSVETGYGKGKLETQTYQMFKKMVDAAKLDNIKLKSVSTYRSYNTQKSLYNNYVKSDGIKEADTYSARPGHSEHQTGFALDINCASRSCKFDTKKEYAWLIQNSYKYGFIERYPKGKEYITGYIYEPWHYRYVGVEAATIIHNENITFEEYHIKYMNK